MRIKQTVVVSSSVTPRPSSNRTGGFPASGFPRPFTAQAVEWQLFADCRCGLLGQRAAGLHLSSRTRSCRDFSDKRPNSPDETCTHGWLVFGIAPTNPH